MCQQPEAELWGFIPSCGLTHFRPGDKQTRAPCFQHDISCLRVQRNSSFLVWIPPAAREAFPLLIPRCSPSSLPPLSAGHDITSSLEPANIDTSILEEYISKEDDSTDMSVGTPTQPGNVKTTRIATQWARVVTKEFVFPDKANPVFSHPPLFLYPSCFSEVHSTPGPAYSSPQAGVSSAGGLVCGVSPPIPLRQGAPLAGPPNCQNAYPPGPSLGLRHNYSCLSQQQQQHQHHQQQQQHQQQAHVKPEHRGHYAPGWAQRLSGR